MKKLLSSLIISVIFSLVILLAVTFLMRFQIPEEKDKFRNISDSIALNLSGQGISRKFVPDFKENDGKFRFVTFTTISSDKKSCTLYVSMLIENHKHITIRYPCQVKDGIIYSVGFEYANEMTFSLIEYIIMGLSLFLISYAIINTAKVIKG